MIQARQYLDAFALKPNAELKMHKVSSIAVKPVVKHRKLLHTMAAIALLVGDIDHKN